MSSPKNVESVQESASSNDSNFNNDDLQDSETCYSDFPTTSPSSSATNSSSFSLYASDFVSSANTGSSESESMAINQPPNFSCNFSDTEIDDLIYCSNSACNFSDTEIDDLMYCSNSDFSSSEHEKAGDDEQECMCTKLEDLLYSNGVAQDRNNYILSSGRCLVNQDSQQEKEKLTIDKEFELYFSKFMS